MDTRLELIEIATTRPDDIKRWFKKNTITDKFGCVTLIGERYIPLLYKGNLRYYDAASLPSQLAGVKQDCKRNKKCINPDHSS